LLPTSQTDTERSHQLTWHGIIAWLQATLDKGKGVSIHGLCKLLWLSQPDAAAAAAAARPVFVLSDTFIRLHGAKAGYGVGTASSVQAQQQQGIVEELNCGRVASRCVACCQMMATCREAIDPEAMLAARP
jgi:hypothetical protein